MKKFALILSIFSFVIGNLHAQNLMRGPYLQSMLPTGVKIMWRTDVPAISKIEFGLSKDNLSETISSDSLEIDHVLELKNLIPSTTYFYKVSANNVLAGGDEWHHFTTAPPFGSTTPFRAWILGDFGAENQDQILVKRSFLEYSAANPVDFWMWLGDNTYTSGKDFEYQNSVFSSDYGYDSIFRYLPFYPTPGNHDYGSVIQGANGVHRGPYFNIVNVFQNGEAGGEPSNTEKYYSYDYGNVHFISLNSESYTEVFLTNLGMKNWLIRDLQKNTQPFTVVYWHQCPYSKGSHNSDAAWEIVIRAMRENFVPILEEYNVDLVLTGHSHVFERSYLMHGHYANSASFDSATMVVNGSSGNIDEGTPYLKFLPGEGDGSRNGTVYVVAGNGGKSEANPALNHPAFFAVDGGEGVCGSLIMDVEDNRIDMRYLRKNGTIGDYFTIIKETSTGINQNEIFQKLNVFPNPSKNEINLELFSENINKIRISLLDINGKQLGIYFDGNILKGNNTIKLDFSNLNLAPGTYFLNITDNENKQESVKIMLLE